MTQIPQTSQKIPLPTSQGNSSSLDSLEKIMPKHHILLEDLASKLGMELLLVVELYDLSPSKYKRFLSDLIKNAEKTKNVFILGDIEKTICRALRLCYDPKLATRKYACEAICSLYENSTTSMKTLLASIMVDSLVDYGGNVRKFRLPNEQIDHRPSKRFCEIAISAIITKEKTRESVKINDNSLYIQDLCYRTLQIHLNDFHVSELDGDYIPDKNLEKYYKKPSKKPKKIIVNKEKIDISRSRTIPHINVDESKIRSDDKYEPQKSTFLLDSTLPQPDFEEKTNFFQQDLQIKKLTSRTLREPVFPPNPSTTREIALKTIKTSIAKFNSTYGRLKIDNKDVSFEKLPINPKKSCICTYEDGGKKLRKLPYDVVYLDQRHLSSKCIEKYEINRIPCGLLDFSGDGNPWSFFRDFRYDTLEAFDNKLNDIVDYSPPIMLGCKKDLDGMRILCSDVEGFFCDLETGEITCIWAEKVEVDQKNNPVTENSIKRGFKKMFGLYS